MITESKLITENCELKSYCHTVLNMYEQLIDAVLEGNNKDLIKKIIKLNKKLETLGKQSECWNFWVTFKYRFLEMKDDKNVD